MFIIDIWILITAIDGATVAKETTANRIVGDATKNEWIWPIIVVVVVIGMMASFFCPMGKNVHYDFNFKSIVDSIDVAMKLVHLYGVQLIQQVKFFFVVTISKT